MFPVPVPPLPSLRDTERLVRRVTHIHLSVSSVFSRYIHGSSHISYSADRFDGRSLSYTARHRDFPFRRSSIVDVHHAQSSARTPLRQVISVSITLSVICAIFCSARSHLSVSHISRGRSMHRQIPLAPTSGTASFTRRLLDAYSCLTLSSVISSAHPLFHTRIDHFINRPRRLPQCPCWVGPSFFVHHWNSLTRSHRSYSSVGQ